MQYIVFKNWHKYQHYKKKAPIWIKLYKSLLRDADFMSMSEAARWQCIGLLLLASECDNAIKLHVKEIQRQLATKRGLRLTEIKSSGLIDIIDKKSISETETYLKTETETDSQKKEARKTETKRGIDSIPNGSHFHSWWDEYPRHVGKLSSYRLWLKCGGGATPESDLYNAAINYAKATRDREKKYIMHPTKFLGPQECWRDYVAGIPEGEEPKSGGGGHNADTDTEDTYGGK